MGKPVKTHLGDMILLPEMVGSMVGVYNVKTFNQVEIKPQTIDCYPGAYSSTYKPLKHSHKCVWVPPTPPASSPSSSCGP
ncbi:40S ribosomal protein S15 [Microtus ochrogaster]|uniref:40S ribosomal protein S15 n=1 Tax=Microtus ochrogaster TaxID=79684 RepID=A0A8J6H0P6_MICOH|nr:40S ribosomal protein S15 [Microtus ochrogaster]